MNATYRNLETGESEEIIHEAFMEYKLSNLEQMHIRLNQSLTEKIQLQQQQSNDSSQLNDQEEDSEEEDSEEEEEEEEIQ